MRLWIDDVRLPPIGYTHVASSYEEAIALLKEHKPEHISFDHDLSANHYRGDFGKERTGYDIACWIEEQVALGNMPKFSWRIHSMNPSGASRIAQALLHCEQMWSRAAVKR